MAERPKYGVQDHLEVTCYKCLRQQKIIGADEAEATRRANLLGWREKERGMVCRRCPGGGKIDREGLLIEGAIEDQRQAIAAAGGA
jgi:hypothetical protein